jgi:hypothetical protein
MPPRRGSPAGVAATACRSVSIAASKSSWFPARPNRSCRAVPRLDSIAAKSGSSAGMAATASPSRSIAASRTAWSPVPRASRNRTKPRCATASGSAEASRRPK